MPETEYAWNAEDYADHSTAQFTWAREMIGKLGLRGSESVLDIGCGDGKITALLASPAP
jgi:trans-aconitate methyltransferase